MPQLRADFLDELREAVDHLASAETRLESLHDLAEHDDLPAEIVSRLGRKRTATQHVRESLIEIPQMVHEGREATT